MARLSLLDVLGSKVRVYLSPPIQKLALAIAVHIIDKVEPKPCICTDYEPFKIVLEPLTTIHPCNHPMKCSSYIVLWCENIADNILSSTLFVAGTPLRAPHRYGLTRLQAQQIDSKTFVLKLKIAGQYLSTIVRVNGIELKELERVPLEAREAKLIETLRTALQEYGILSQRDAIDIISAELGVKRAEARRLLLELIRKNMLVVEEGYIVDVKA